jgi:hypothetical protein
VFHFLKCLKPCTLSKKIYFLVPNIHVSTSSLKDQMLSYRNTSHEKSVDCKVCAYMNTMGPRSALFWLDGLFYMTDMRPYFKCRHLRILSHRLEILFDFDRTVTGIRQQAGKCHACWTILGLRGEMERLEWLYGGRWAWEDGWGVVYLVPGIYHFIDRPKSSSQRTDRETFQRTVLHTLSGVGGGGQLCTYIVRQNGSTWRWNRAKVYPTKNIRTWTPLGSRIEKPVYDLEAVLQPHPILQHRKLVLSHQR